MCCFTLEISGSEDIIWLLNKSIAAFGWEIILVWCFRNLFITLFQNSWASWDNRPVGSMAGLIIYGLWMASKIMGTSQQTFLRFQVHRYVYITCTTTSKLQIISWYIPVTEVVNSGLAKDGQYYHHPNHRFIQIFVCQQLSPTSTQNRFWTVSFLVLIKSCSFPRPWHFLKSILYATCNRNSRKRTQAWRIHRQKANLLWSTGLCWTISIRVMSVGYVPLA
jgi:hypothetical protein